MTNLADYCEQYFSYFKVYRRKNDGQFLQYMTGLFHHGKHNIERMNEQVKDATYHQLHHFISESAWEHKPLLKQLGLDISSLLSKKGGLKGLVIDEEGHVKKGKHSVGVSRQYLGSIGKVDNGQVSVFAALNQGDDVGMVNVNRTAEAVIFTTRVDKR